MEEELLSFFGMLKKSRFLLLHSIIFFALAVYTHMPFPTSSEISFFLFLEGGETKKVEDGISSFVSLHEALSPRGFQFRALSVLFLFLPPWLSRLWPSNPTESLLQEEEIQFGDPLCSRIVP